MQEITVKSVYQKNLYQFLSLLFVLLFTVTSDARVFPDEAIFTDDVTVQTANGINVGDGTDQDTDLVTVDVTGAPIFSWDESEDAFSVSKSIVFQSLTADRVVYIDANGQLQSTGISSTVAGYLDPTSSVQTQLDSKVTDSFTSSRVLVSDGSGNVSASSTTTTTLGYLDVSSSLTTLLDGKVDEIVSVDNVMTRFDGVGGDIQTSGIVIDDSDNINNVTSLAIGSASNSDASSLLDLVSTSRGSRPCPSMTAAQRDAISTPATGLCIYNSDTDALNIYDSANWVAVGSGAGGGGGLARQYFSDRDADDTSKVATYDDGAVTEPVDGTGGSPSTATVSSETTDPIFGSASYLLSKSAADGQGEGWGIITDVTLDEAADAGRTQTVQFFLSDFS